MHEGSSFSAEQPAILTDLTNAASTLWESAKNPTSGVYAPDLVVSHDGERATFMMRHSPTVYTQVGLYYDAEGTMHVEHQQRRPTLEYEGFGQFAVTTTDQALKPGVPAFSTYEKTRHDSCDIEEPGLPVAVPNSNLNADKCQQYIDWLRTIRGEKPERPERESRIGKWLSRRALHTR